MSIENFVCSRCGNEIFKSNVYENSTDIYHILCDYCLEELENEDKLPSPILEINTSDRFYWNEIKGAEKYIIRYGWGEIDTYKIELLQNNQREFSYPNKILPDLTVIATFCKIAAVSKDGRIGQWSKIRATGIKGKENLLASIHSHHFYGDVNAIEDMNKIFTPKIFDNNYYLSILNTEIENPFYILEVKIERPYIKLKIVTLSPNTLSCSDVLEMLKKCFNIENIKDLC